MEHIGTETNLAETKYGGLRLPCFARHSGYTYLFFSDQGTLVQVIYRVITQPDLGLGEDNKRIG